MTVSLSFEKLYKSARQAEPCTAAVPVKHGLLTDTAAVADP